MSCSNNSDSPLAFTLSNAVKAALLGSGNKFSAVSSCAIENNVAFLMHSIAKHETSRCERLNTLLFILDQAHKLISSRKNSRGNNANTSQDKGEDKEVELLMKEGLGKKMLEEFCFPLDCNGQQMLSHKQQILTNLAKINKGIKSNITQEDIKDAESLLESVASITLKYLVHKVINDPVEGIKSVAQHFIKCCSQTKKDQAHFICDCESNAVNSKQSSHASSSMSSQVSKSNVSNSSSQVSENKKRSYSSSSISSDTFSKKDSISAGSKQASDNLSSSQGKKYACSPCSTDSKKYTSSSSTSMQDSKKAISDPCGCSSKNYYDACGASSKKTSYDAFGNNSKSSSVDNKKHSYTSTPRYGEYDKSSTHSDTSSKSDTPSKYSYDPFRCNNDKNSYSSSKDTFTKGMKEQAEHMKDSMMSKAEHMKDSMMNKAEHLKENMKENVVEPMQNTIRSSKSSGSGLMMAAWIIPAAALVAAMIYLYSSHRSNKSINEDAVRGIAYEQLYNESSRLNESESTNISEAVKDTSTSALSVIDDTFKPTTNDVSSEKEEKKPAEEQKRKKTPSKVTSLVQKGKKHIKSVNKKVKSKISRMKSSMANSKARIDRKMTVAMNELYPSRGYSEILSSIRQSAMNAEGRNVILNFGHKGASRWVPLEAKHLFNRGQITQTLAKWYNDTSKTLYVIAAIDKIKGKYRLMANNVEVKNKSEAMMLICNKIREAGINNKVRIYLLDMSNNQYPMLKAQYGDPSELYVRYI